MYLFRVTVYVKKEHMEPPGYPLGWACIADTPESAIKQVIDNLDTTGVEIMSTKAVLSNEPIVLG